MSPSDGHHLTQRLRVGLIGLAVVIALIALAAGIRGSVSHERPIAAVGAATPDTVANLAIANDVGTEPLAELGVAPGAGNQFEAATEH